MRQITLISLLPAAASLLASGCGGEAPSEAPAPPAPTAPAAAPKKSVEPRQLPRQLPRLISKSGCSMPTGADRVVESSGDGTIWEGSAKRDTRIYACSGAIGKVFLIQRLPDDEFILPPKIKVTKLNTDVARYRVESESAAAEGVAFTTYEANLETGRHREVDSGVLAGN